MAEELSPAELEGELMRDRHVVPRADRGQRVRHIEQTVRQVWGQARDGAV
jgi:hypothetical protein